MLSLKDDIKSVKGIGEKTALLLSKASVFCVNDLLHYFPRNYSYVPESCPISDLSESGNVIVTAKVVTAPRVYSSGGKSILSFDISDKSDIMHVYYFGMPYLKNNFKVGMECIFYGGFSITRKGKMLSQPSILKPDEYESIKGSLVPLYPLIKGLLAKLITK
jgi:ATP-dependent DNA helicase RecG